MYVRDKIEKVVREKRKITKHFTLEQTCPAFHQYGRGLFHGEDYHFVSFTSARFLTKTLMNTCCYLRTAFCEVADTAKA
jgi:hypothetical protein